MAATLGLVLDCTDPESLAAFWADAIGYTIVGGAGNYVMLVDESRRQPKLLLQRVAEAKAGKHRMHFDIETADVDTEAARLEALGARRLEAEPVEEHGTRWIVMADPEGNEFCVCDGGTASDG